MLASRRCLLLAALTLALAAACSSKSSGTAPSAGCGDGVITFPETCDDGNTTSTDGCSASCQIELGYTCTTPGKPCVKETPVCGDGKVTSPETCDDGNATSGDGCSGACQIEDGWACPPTGGACHQAVCGDGKLEGKEQCDDGNTLPFDGCDATCHKEVCTGTSCTGFCGDGIVEPGEACDDGNNLNGDGCSADCKLEDIAGITCNETTTDLPASITVPVVFRDFKGYDERTSVPVCKTGLGPFSDQLANGCANPDFQNLNNNVTCGMVQTTLGTVASRPGVGVPVANPTQSVSGAYDFSCAISGSNGSSWLQKDADGAFYFPQWYADVSGVNRTVVSSFTLARQGTGSTYVVGGGGAQLFPLDAIPTTCTAGAPCAWGISPETLGTTYVHDFGFTSEVRYAFTYQGGEVLSFTGDDDVWVFINSRLAVDIGGVHGATTATVTLAAGGDSRFGIVPGSIYEMALFHAERHTTASNFMLTLGGFVKRTTVCKSTCGDGVVAPDEECDLGAQNGQSGSSCSSTCTWVRAR